MNPFKEYLDLSIKGLKNADKVLSGLKTKVIDRFKLLDNERRQIIAERYDICTNCPYNSRNAKQSAEFYKLQGKHYDTSRSELHCSLCGCIIEYKTSSLYSNCGIEEWNKENPEKQLPLKWTKYEKGK